MCYVAAHIAVRRCSAKRWDTYAVARRVSSDLRPCPLRSVQARGVEARLCGVGRLCSVLFVGAVLFACITLSEYGQMDHGPQTLMIASASRISVDLRRGRALVLINAPVRSSGLTVSVSSAYQAHTDHGSGLSSDGSPSATSTSLRRPPHPPAHCIKRSKIMRQTTSSEWLPTPRHPPARPPVAYSVAWHFPIRASLPPKSLKEKRELPHGARAAPQSTSEQAHLMPADAGRRLSCC